MKRLLLMSLIVAQQIVMPVLAHADESQAIAQIGEIERRAQLLKQSDKLHAQLVILEEKNRLTLQSIDHVREQLRAVDMECKETCAGPATHALIDGISELSKTSAASSAAAFGVRSLVQSFYKSQSVEKAEQFAATSRPFKRAFVGAFVASGAAYGVSAWVEHYINLRDTLTLTQRNSLAKELTAMEQTLSDSNSHVRSIVQEDVRISEALQQSMVIQATLSGK